MRVAMLLAVACGLVLALVGLDREDVVRFLAGGMQSVPTAQRNVSMPLHPPIPREVSMRTDLYRFDYAYPAQAAAIPALRDLLEARLEESRAQIEAEAEASRRDARARNYPFQPHFLDLGWQVSADLPGWLGLVATAHSYGGGAHPNQHFEALVWDRQTGRTIAPLAMFQSAEALDAAVRNRYCAALDRERAQRREQTIAQVRADEMWKCPAVADLVVALESRGGLAFDHLLLLAAPYVAGPFAEGSYEMSIAVDKAVLAAVKPEFRPAFRLAR